MLLQLNKPYIAFVATVGTGTLMFIGWAITSQVYTQWSHDLPITGGWNWPIVIGIDVLCLLGVLALYWKIYADVNTKMSAEGLSRPTLRGAEYIAWPDVTTIKVLGGVGFHVYAGCRKIVLSPYAYRDPDRVIEALRQFIARGKT